MSRSVYGRFADAKGKNLGFVRLNYSVDTCFAPSVTPEQIRDAKLRVTQSGTAEVPADEGEEWKRDIQQEFLANYFAPADLRSWKARAEEAEKKLEELKGLLLK